MRRQKNNRSKSNRARYKPSVQKNNQKMSFIPENKQHYHKHFQVSNPNLSLNYQAARLFANQKILFLKTSAQKNLPLEEIFLFYPYTQLDFYRFQIEKLISFGKEQNPQAAQAPVLMGSIVKDQNGVHLVQTVTIVTEEQKQQNNLKTNHNLEVFNGSALSIFQNGTVFQGSYHDGHFCGTGLQINLDGDLYLGKFKNGMKKGDGTFYSFQIGEVYTGKWQSDLPHGLGILLNQCGTYEGNFGNGRKNGLGIQKFNNGDYYTGQYLNGVCEGYGQYFWADGSIYKGDFSHGKRHGFGIWNDENQSYFGSYKMDKKQGIGIYTWRGKHVYKGYFKNDLREGYGQLYQIRGSSDVKKVLYKGNWQKGLKDNNTKINLEDVQQLTVFLQQQNQLIEQIPTKKKKVGHKDCIPNGSCLKKH